MRLGLHGHVHEDRVDLIGYVHPATSLFMAGAGSFGAPARARPELTPRLYNLLEVSRELTEVKVHTRCLRREGEHGRVGQCGPVARRRSVALFIE